MIGKFCIWTLTVLAVLSVSACGGDLYLDEALQRDQEFAEAYDKCETACEIALLEGESLKSGPCLLNGIEGTDYVCDIAHNPRKSVDNDSANQCSTYGDEYEYYIEFDEVCEFIRGSSEDGKVHRGR